MTVCNDPNLSAALAAAAAGWPVTTCKPGTKHTTFKPNVTGEFQHHDGTPVDWDDIRPAWMSASPLRLTPQGGPKGGYWKSTCNEHIIRRMWADVPGAVPGMPLCPRWMVVDEDIDSATGTTWMPQHVKSMLREQSELVVRTASGGHHYYLQDPQDPSWCKQGGLYVEAPYLDPADGRTKNRSAGDLKVTFKGFVCPPGTVFPGIGVYEVVKGTWPLEPLSPPKHITHELAAALSEMRRRSMIHKPVNAPIGALNGGTEITGQIQSPEDQLSELARTPLGGRHNAYRTMIGHWVATGIVDETWQERVCQQRRQLASPPDTGTSAYADTKALWAHAIAAEKAKKEQRKNGSTPTTPKKNAKKQETPVDPPADPPPSADIGDGSSKTPYTDRFYAVDFVRRNFFVTTRGRKLGIGHVSKPNVLYPCWSSADDVFADVMPYYNWKTPEGEEKVSRLSWSAVKKIDWLVRELRRVVGFLPPGTPDHLWREMDDHSTPTGEAPTAANLLNTWRGLAVAPKEGDVSAWTRHVYEVICRRNDETYQWFLTWCSALVKFPGRNSQHQVVLRSGHGAGKDVMITVLARIFRSENVARLQNSNAFRGNFNAELSGKVLIQASEAVFAGDRRMAAYIKGQLTEPTILIERKGFDPVFEINSWHLIATTNEKFAVHVELGDRRHLVLDVDSSRAIRDHHSPEEKAKRGKYFAAVAATDPAALLNYLLQIDIPDYWWHVDPPMTAAKKRMQAASLEAVDTFALEAIQRGGFLISQADQGAEVRQQEAGSKLIFLPWTTTMKAKDLQQAWNDYRKQHDPKWMFAKQEFVARTGGTAQKIGDWKDRKDGVTWEEIPTRLVVVE